MKKVLLHICCAVCASESIRRLLEEGFYVVGFFYNPNIHPRKEYEERKKDLEIIKKVFRMEIIEAEYDVRNWFEVTKDYKNLPEGSLRCQVCWRMRLEKTFSFAKRMNFDFFTTTLTISPHKNSKKIFEVGKSISPTFLERDFKKKDGFKKAIEFSKKYNLRRQNYCGCVYSLLERWKRKSIHLTGT